MPGRIRGGAIALGLIVAAACLLAQAQPIPLPFDGETPEFPESAKPDPTVERGAPDSPETTEHPTGAAVKPLIGPKSEGDADPCAGDAACYQRLDLQAQQDMADAAYWMTIATWAQVGVSVLATIIAGIGALWVLRSLRLTREIFIADKRAWIGIAQKDIRLKDGIKWNENGVRVHIQITARNIGQHPAHNVWFQALVYLNEDERRAAIDRVARDARSMGRAFSDHTIFRDGVLNLGVSMQVPMSRIVSHAEDVSKTVKRVIPPDQKSLFIKIAGCIDYGIITKDERRSTIFTADLYRVRDDKPLPINRVSGDIPVEELRLIVRQIIAD